MWNPRPFPVHSGKRWKLPLPVPFCSRSGLLIINAVVLDMPLAARRERDLSTFGATRCNEGGPHQHCDQDCRCTPHLTLCKSESSLAQPVKALLFLVCYSAVSIGCLDSPCSSKRGLPASQGSEVRDDARPQWRHGKEMCPSIPSHLCPTAFASWMFPIHRHKWTVRLPIVC